MNRKGASGAGASKNYIDKTGGEVVCYFSERLRVLSIAALRSAQRAG